MSKLTGSERSFTEATEMREELEVVDEYFRSSPAMTHQFPFNREATRLKPPLSKILNPRSSYPNVDNPLFARKLLHLIYKRWVCLPLWTRLLFNFNECHANDVEPRSPCRANDTVDQTLLSKDYSLRSSSSSRELVNSVSHVAQ